jgi:hypothetical protein
MKVPQDGGEAKAPTPPSCASPRIAWRLESVFSGLSGYIVASHKDTIVLTQDLSLLESKMGGKLTLKYDDDSERRQGARGGPTKKHLWTDQDLYQ